MGNIAGTTSVEDVGDWEWSDRSGSIECDVLQFIQSESSGIQHVDVGQWVDNIVEQCVLWMLCVAHSDASSAFDVNRRRRVSVMQSITR